MLKIRFFVNWFRYRDDIAVLMDNAAIENKSEDEVISEMAQNFADKREDNKIMNRIFGAVWVVLGGPVIATVGLWKFVESFDKVPFVDRENPFQSEGLKPELDYVRAERIVKKHYGKRFSNGIAPKKYEI